MKFRGKIKSVNPYANEITFEVIEGNFEDTDRLKERDLEIKADIFRGPRSAEANKLLWECIGRIAKAKNQDKWKVYLDMLKHYGKYTYVCVKPNVVEAIKEQWRECEEIGEIEINGKKAVQLLCYFGSSTYNSQEFAQLLDGILAEMRDGGLETPGSEELDRALEQWNQYCK